VFAAAKLEEPAGKIDRIIDRIVINEISAFLFKKFHLFQFIFSRGNQQREAEHSVIHIFTASISG